MNGPAAKALTVLLAASGLASCVTARVERQVADLERRCDFSADPRFAVLRGKVPLGPSELKAPPTTAEFGNPATPTPAERTALELHESESRFCRIEALVLLEKHAPPLASIARSLDGAVVRQRLALTRGEITYGQFRANTYELLAAADRAAADVAMNQQVADAARQQAAAAQLSATLQAVEAAIPRRPAPLPMLTPAPLNCTSTQIGRFVNTSCM